MRCPSSGSSRARSPRKRDGGALSTGSFCGHIHHAVIRDDLGLRYINCGDGVESCTAVIEDFNGQFEIVRWTELQLEQSLDSSVTPSPRPSPQTGRGSTAPRLSGDRAAATFRRAT